MAALYFQSLLEERPYNLSQAAVHFIDKYAESDKRMGSFGIYHVSKFTISTGNANANKNTLELTSYANSDAYSNV